MEGCEQPADELQVVQRIVNCWLAIVVYRDDEVGPFQVVPEAQSALLG